MKDPQVGWIAAIIIGGVAGWLAEQFMKSQMGLLMNIVLGIIGAAVASAIFELLRGSARRMDRLSGCRVHRRSLADLDRAGGKGDTVAWDQPIAEIVIRTPPDFYFVSAKKQAAGIGPTPSL